MVAFIHIPVWVIVIVSFAILIGGAYYFFKHIK